jgi:hypothetical protein
VPVPVLWLRVEVELLPALVLLCVRVRMFVRVVVRVLTPTLEPPPRTKISPRGRRCCTTVRLLTPTKAGPRFFFFRRITVRRDGSLAAIKRCFLRLTTTSVREPPPRTKVRLPPPMRTLTLVREPRPSRPDVLSLRVVVWLRVVVL